MDTSRLLAAMLLTVFVAHQAAAQPTATPLINTTKGKPELAEVVVDSAPGSVSAVGLLGISGDQLVTVDNPRDFTLAFKPSQEGGAFGISFTPARTAIAPMSVSTYYHEWWAPIVAGTTFGYAQTKATINEKGYRQRATSIETSFYLQPKRDDPAVLYWLALEKASKSTDREDPCVFSPPQTPVDSPVPPSTAAAQPSGPVVPKSAEAVTKKALDDRAEECRNNALKGARWNPSRAWASYVDGRYSPESGAGGSKSLGRTLVLGASWGFGDAGAPRASAIALAAKRSWDEPTLKTLDATSPTRKNTQLITVRGAYGSDSLRALVEGSHLKSDDPTASERTYKRAVGIDFKMGKGTWLVLRTGKQRRVDGSGDESGSSVSLSVSPVDLLKF